VAEMSCGEALEFQHARNLDVTEEQYEALVRAKTGSLIGAATELGAGSNGAAHDLPTRARYRALGEAIGIAFQIVDDLLDYEGDPEVTGKPVGSDLAEGKITLPLIAALRTASEADRRKLVALAGRTKWTPRQWTQLKELVERAGGFAEARRRALELADQARVLANAEPLANRDGVRDVRRALDRAIDYAVRRDR